MLVKLNFEKRVFFKLNSYSILLFNEQTVHYNRGWGYVAASFDWDSSKINQPIYRLVSK